jgi:hypothetical protein
MDIEIDTLSGITTFSHFLMGACPSQKFQLHLLFELAAKRKSMCIAGRHRGLMSSGNEN